MDKTIFVGLKHQHDDDPQSVFFVGVDYYSTIQLSSSLKQVNIIMTLCLMAKKIGVTFFYFHTIFVISV